VTVQGLNALHDIL